METKIGIPSASGMMEAVKSGLYGAAGAFVFQFVGNYFGSSLIGSLVGIALAGSVVKGEQGKMIATLLGYELVRSGNFSLGGGSNQESAGEAEIGVI